MKTFKIQLLELQDRIVHRLIELIDERGVESKHSNDKVLKIQNDDLMYNIEGGRYLVELNEEKLVDNQGYTYNHDSLDLEQLCEIVDAIADEPVEEEEEEVYRLKEDGIHIIGSHGVTLNEKIRQEELHEYYIEDRKEFIDTLIGWIAEAEGANKSMMRQDLEMLMDREEDYMLSSNSTNSYIFEGDSDFNETCQELIELHESLEVEA